MADLETDEMKEYRKKAKEYPIHPRQTVVNTYERLPESPNYEGYRQTMNGLQMMRSAMPTVRDQRFGELFDLYKELRGVTQLGPDTTSIDDISRSTKEARLQAAMKEMEKRQSYNTYAPKNNRDPYPDYFWNNDPFYEDKGPSIEYGTRTVYPANRPKVGRR
jgi:hypothetical protein